MHSRHLWTASCSLLPIVQRAAAHCKRHTLSWAASLPASCSGCAISAACSCTIAVFVRNWALAAGPGL